MATRKLTDTEQQMCKALDAYHHRQYVTAESIRKKSRWKSSVGVFSRTLSKLVGRGIVELSTGAGYRLSPEGRKLYRSVLVLGG